MLLFNFFFNSSCIIVHFFCVTIQLLFGCCLAFLIVGWILVCCWLTLFALPIEIFYIVDKFFLYCYSFLLHCYLGFLVLFGCYLALLVATSSSCCWSTPLVNVGWLFLLLVLLVGFFFGYCLSPLIVLIDYTYCCLILLLWWSAILLLLFNFCYCCFVPPSLSTFLT